MNGRQLPHNNSMPCTRTRRSREQEQEATACGHQQRAAAERVHAGVLEVADRRRAQRQPARGRARVAERGQVQRQRDVVRLVVEVRHCDERPAERSVRRAAGRTPMRVDGRDDIRAPRLYGAVRLPPAEHGCIFYRKRVPDLPDGRVIRGIQARGHAVDHAAPRVRAVKGFKARL